MAHTYRIRSGHLVYLAGFSVLWFGIVVWTAISNAPDHWTGGTFATALLVVLFALVPAFAMARIPYEVTVSSDGTCLFRSLVFSRTVRAQRIRSISVDEGDIKIRHDRRKITMRSTQDFDDFLAQLVELNPAIELDRTLEHVVAGRGG